MLEQEFITGINRCQRADSPEGASQQGAVSGSRAWLPRALIPAHLESVPQDNFPMRALLSRGVQLDFWAVLARELLGNGAFCLEERKARTDFYPHLHLVFEEGAGELDDGAPAVLG